MEKDHRVVYDGLGNASAEVTMRVCPDCGRRHFEMEAKPLDLNLTGKGI